MARPPGEACAAGRGVQPPPGKACWARRGIPAKQSKCAAEAAMKSVLVPPCGEACHPSTRTGRAAATRRIEAPPPSLPRRASEAARRSGCGSCCLPWPSPYTPYCVGTSGGLHPEFRGTAGTLLYVQKSAAFLMLTSHAGFSHCQTRTRSFVTYNEKRYDINDGLSTRVHELAFGIVICFGS